MQILSITIVSIFMMLWSLSGISLPAQTRFLLPDTTPDLSRYHHVDECIAAARRVMAEVRRVYPVWNDTMPASRSITFDSLPPGARQIATKCAEPFNAESVSLDHFQRWMTLFLMAGRDTDARRVLERRIALLSPDSIGARHNIWSEAFDIFVAARPIRVSDAEFVMAQMEATLDSSDLRDFYRVSGIRFNFYRNILGDSTRSEQVASHIIAQTKRLTDLQRESKSYEGYGAPIVYQVLEFLRRYELSDSLKKSTESFLALKRVNWAEATQGKRGELSMLGDHAEKIDWDFKAEQIERDKTSFISYEGNDEAGRDMHMFPVPDRIGLVVFLRSDCRQETTLPGPHGRGDWRNGYCWDTYAALRRLSERFPELDVTIVSQTTGHIGFSDLLPPQEEAKLLAAWWLDYHKLPGRLLVKETPFIRLPEYDNRRVDDEVENNLKYMIPFLPGADPRRAFIVDTNGTIVHAGRLDKSSETAYVEILDALFWRELNR